VNLELRLLARVDGFLTVWGNPILNRAALPRLVFPTLTPHGAVSFLLELVHVVEAGE
jgi:hypothetical protein